MTDEMSFNLERPKVLRDQIAEQMRARLIEKFWKPGDQLPSTAALAETMKVDPATVHRALTLLVKEGMLSRTRGRGTFVRDRPKCLSRVGIYELSHVRLNPEYRSGQVLHAEIQTALATRNIAVQTLVDARHADDAGIPFEGVVEACARHRIDAMIAISADRYREQWMAKLPVPVSIHGSSNSPFVVAGDPPAVLTIAAEEIARQGCRSVALLTFMPSEHRNSDGSVHDYERAHGEFRETCARLNLELRDYWMPQPDSERLPSSHSDYQFRGHEQFKKLWDGPRPDGLIVTDDVVEQGVITAMLELGVRVPQDLKLVFLRHREIGLLCPFRASFVEYSLREEAQALIEHMERQFRGEPPKRMVVPPHLIRWEEESAGKRLA